jgi:hypothetical protein
MINHVRLLLTRASLVACGVFILACGTAKDPRGGRVPPPNFRRPERPVEDKNTLTLKSENLKLTLVGQVLKINSFTQESGAEKYLKLQKKFSFPIQFNGWVTLNRVEHNYLECAQEASEDPSFILEDDHKGAIPLYPGVKTPVNLEKLYVVRLEFTNVSSCKGIDNQFDVLYELNE